VPATAREQSGRPTGNGGVAVNVHETWRYADLTLVPDGDGFVVGSPHAADFLAVPKIGGLVVRWLQEGHDIDECAVLAERHAGQFVDVRGFLERLSAEGLLSGAGAEPAPAPARPARSPRGHWLGRVLYGRAGLLAQFALAAAGLVVLITHPGLRPHYTDAIVTDVPLASLLIATVMGVAGGLLHEAAHVLAAAAKGVRSSISIGRRLYTLVYQTDLTRLWSLPRRDRLLPLSAGMLLDAAVAGLTLLLLAGPWPITQPVLVDVARAIVLLKLSGILFQAEVFMRTDLYAVLATISGCHNLWATKDAVARRLIRRAGADDLAHLAAVSRHEIRWATAYLVLYIPGVGWATWYLVVFVLPTVWTLLGMSISAVALQGLGSPLGVAGVLSAVLVALPMAGVLLGAVRGAARGLRTVLRPDRASRT
jgi:putative peptide zinc metalloprotease protein